MSNQTMTEDRVTAEQIGRWKEKLQAAESAEVFPRMRSMTDIAAQMLAQAEDRENRMAEACAASRGHVDRVVHVIFPGDPAWAYVAEWDDSRKAYVTKDDPGANHGGHKRERRQCALHRQCASPDGHHGDCMFLGSA